MISAELRRTPGIHSNHRGIEGNIPRAILALMEEGGVVQLDTPTMRWYFHFARPFGEQQE